MTLPGAVRPWLQWRCWFLPIAALWAMVLPHLNQGAWSGDTAYYAAIGVQAWRTGRLWTLFAEPGHPYFNKPPLAFWIHGLSLHLFGPSLWAARLPTVLAATGCVLATIALARTTLGRWSSLAVGLVLVTTYEFFHRAGAISLDMWQCMFVTLSAAAFVRAALRDWRAGFVISGASLGLALMCKPLVALACIPFFAAWLCWIGRFRLLPWLFLVLAVAVAVAAPWHLSMTLLHPGFIRQYLGREVLDRAAGINMPGHSREIPPWFYLQVIAMRYWPWLPALIAACAALFARKLPARGEHLARFALIWSAGWILALSAFPDRRDRYDIPIYVGLAVLAGMWLAGAPRRLRRICRVVVARLPVIIPIGGVLLAALPLRLYSPEPAHWRAFREWYAAAHPAEIWNGDCGPAQAATVYLMTGAWPRLPADSAISPQEGSLLLYHHRGSRRPGPNETDVLNAGDLRLTRLGPGGWRPVAVDPSESAQD